MMPTQQAFWDKVADKYDRKTVKGPNYAARLDRAARWVGPEASVLDVGCAGGQITLDLARRVRQVRGIDISARLIELAARRQQAEGPANCRFDVGDAFDSSLKPGSFDAITAYSLLHLVDDIPATLRRLHELLRPGGRLIVELPTTEEIGWHFRLLIRGMMLVGKAPVVTVRKPVEILAMFRDAGFVIDEVAVYNPRSMNRGMLATRPANGSKRP